MSGGKTKDLILEEARREHDEWVRANRSLKNRASLFIGIDTFILVSVIDLDPPKFGWHLVLSLVAISFLLYIFMFAENVNSEVFFSTNEFMRLSEFDRAELQEELIGKYGIAEEQRNSLRRKSRLVKWGSRFTMMALGAVGYIFLTQA